MPPVPNVLKILIGGFVDNVKVQNWANVLHVGYSGTAPTNANLVQYCNQIHASWVTNMAPECPAPTSLATIQVTDLTSDTSASGELNTVAQGTRGDDSGPANAAVLVSYTVPQRWRGGHPRTYLYVGGVADYQGAAEWATAFQAEVLAHWQTFLNQIVPFGAGGTAVNDLVCVRTHGKFLPNGGPPNYVLNTPQVIPLNSANTRVSAEIASQRGRVGRTARNSSGALP
jgi:hypothetical protein